MDIKLIYWIKFTNEFHPKKQYFIPPERYIFNNSEEMWYTLREIFLREGRLIEWMVREL